MKFKGIVFWLVGLISGALIPFMPLWVMGLVGFGTGLAYRLTEDF